MWDFISPVNLIRYLIVWRVNGPLVQLPRYLPTTLSQVMGTIIANRLPTQQVREWRKVLQAWDDVTATIPQAKQGGRGAGGQGSRRSAGQKSSPLPARPPALPPPDAAWPIETVVFAYPGKRSYGQGEAILWELKLLADSADHGLFLELILPAMEEAATTSDPRWHLPRSLWGRFDIQAVYAARGVHWEPVVSEGRLNLQYRASPSQWAEGLAFGPVGTPVELPSQRKRRFHHLTWITPVELGLDRASNNPKSAEPTLQGILDALMGRMALFLPGKHRTAKDAWALLSPDEQAAISLALQQAKPRSQPHHALKPVPKNWPGRWIGTQTFAIIPERLLPYLELASILHVGKQAHFGCGTFVLT